MLLKNLSFRSTPSWARYKICDLNHSFYCVFLLGEDWTDNRRFENYSQYYNRRRLLEHDCTHSAHGSATKRGVFATIAPADDGAFSGDGERREDTIAPL